MGVAELISAFNEVAGPQFNCTRALLTYEQGTKVQFQRLTFHGIAADGTEFVTRSDQLRPETDVVLAARLVAAKFVADSKPAEG